jgi:hypothetical protein
MASENVESVRAGYVEIARFYDTRDPEAIRAHIERFFHPDCVLSAGSPEVFVEGEWSGHDGIFRFMTNQLEAFEGMWIEPQDFIETGEEWLLVPIRFGGRTRHTGIEVELSPVHAFRLLDGRATEFLIYRTLPEALAGIGAQARLTDS